MCTYNNITNAILLDAKPTLSLRSYVVRALCSFPLLPPAPSLPGGCEFAIILGTRVRPDLPGGQEVGPRHAAQDAKIALLKLHVLDVPRAPIDQVAWRNAGRVLGLS